MEIGPAEKLLSRRGVPPELSGEESELATVTFPEPRWSCFPGCASIRAITEKPAAETIRDKLTEEQYRVTQENDTERAFTGEFWNRFEKGIYVDIVTGEPLFSSTDKFESGCGWPAFTKPIEEPAVVEREDLSHGMRRTEVQKPRGRFSSGSCVHRRSGISQRRALLHQQRVASLRALCEGWRPKGYGYLLYLFEE